MAAIEYFRTAIKNFHTRLSDAVKDLNETQVYFRPIDKGNHIAFTLWHVIRTEDIVIQFFLQKKKPVWNEQGWDQRFGMDPKAQGTGFTPEQAAALRISDLKEFLRYMENVFRASEAYLESLSDKDLEEIRELPVLGKRSLYQTIGGIVLEHGSGHLGEIWYLKGLQGLKGSPI